MKLLMRLGWPACLIVAAFGLPMAESALAATLHNVNGETVTVTVTEKGSRNNISIAADEHRLLCERGCFVTFPGGAILPLKGGEEVVFEVGRARIAKP